MRRLGMMAACILTGVGLAVPTHAAVFDVTAFGANPAHGNNDRAAVQAAADAACAAGGGEVHFPAGFYRIGREQGAGGAFYSGLQIHCDNIVVSGVGDQSVLMPLNSGGQTVIIVCDAFTGPFNDHLCVPTNPVNNVTIRDLKIWDDDPFAHCVQSVGLSCASEESHGVTVRNGHQVNIERVTFENLGDESVVFGAGSSFGRVRDSNFVNCPSTASSGSCIELDWGSNYVVLNNQFEGGVAGGNSIIDINNNSPNEVQNVVILGNQINESGTTAIQRVEDAIALSPNQAALRDIFILGNTISNDFFNRRVINITTSSFGVDNLELSSNTMAGTIDLASYGLRNLVFTANTVTGSLADTAALAVGGQGLVVDNNSFSGQRAGCIWIRGADGSTQNVEITNNSCQTNSDAIAEAAISVTDAACDPDDGVSGSFRVAGNWVWPPPGGAVTVALRLSECSEATVENNSLFLAGRSQGHGIFGGEVITENTIDRPGGDGIRVKGSGVLIQENWIAGSTCVVLDGEIGGSLNGNDLSSCSNAITEINGASGNSCWNNAGVSGGCSLLLECQDGLDNDNDGKVDAADPDCTALDPFSETRAGASCGLGPEISPLLALLLAARKRRSQHSPRNP